MSAIFFLLGVATLIAFIVFWWKKRTARKNAGESYKDDVTYKKVSLIKRGLGVACVLCFVLMIATLPKTEKSNSSGAEPAATIAEQTTSADNNLGFTSDNLINGYNESIDNIGKKNSRTYNELKIDKNKVQNNSITLVDTATISWHENDGIVDAVTAVMKISSSKAQIYEMALLATLIRNTDTLQQFLNKTKSEEKRIELHDGNITIIRTAGQKIAPGVDGITLLVCTDEYYANMEKKVKAVASKLQQEQQIKKDGDDTLSIEVGFGDTSDTVIVPISFKPNPAEAKRHKFAILAEYECGFCGELVYLFAYDTYPLPPKELQEAICDRRSQIAGHEETHVWGSSRHNFIKQWHTDLGPYGEWVDIDDHSVVR